MSLNVDLRDIEDFENLCYERAAIAEIGEEEATRRVDIVGWGSNWRRDGAEIVRQHPITHALLWGAMNIGIDEITEKNAGEVVLRHRILAVIYGAPMKRGEEDYFLTLEDVNAHIGLKTNVSVLTPAKFRASLARRVRQQAMDMLRTGAV